MTAIKPTSEKKPLTLEDYPTRDGKSAAETEWHLLVLMYLFQVLRHHCAGRPDVYVSGNNFVFWEEGNPSARVAPDVYVVFGVEKKVRDSYMAWLEGGKLPDVVIEITSRKTRHEDERRKRPLYEQVWKTSEYFQFDPKSEYLSPALQGLRLVNGVYQPIPLDNQRMYSEQLGLDFVAEGSSLRLYDPIHGRFLPTLPEAAALAEAAPRRAETEAQARHEAEANVAQLRAELEALRKQLGNDAE